MALMDGKVCLVTGASSGIGVETARGLGRLGATVLCVGRSPERTEAIAETLRGEGIDASAWLADFASLREVARLGEEVAEAHPVLDVVVHNAGLMHPKRSLSADGYEDTFAVNHLAPFLLTQRLRASLEAAERARVVVVSSRLHRGARSTFDDCMFERRRYNGMAAYRESKLANVMFARELAERLDGAGVTSNSLHPGDVATNVVRDSRVLQWALDHIARPFVKTPEEGARCSIHVASAPELEGVTGRYFRDSKEAKAHPAADDADARAALWALSEELVEHALR